MRKRRPKVVWLPPDRFNVLGASPGTGATSALQSGIKQIVTAVPGGTGSSHTEVIPVVADGDIDPVNQLRSLSDVENSAYRLRRVVGKIFVGIEQSSSDAQGPLPTEVICTAGLIVLRVKDQAGLQPVPLNSVEEEYSTQMLQNWADPWIWRRTWVLGNIPQEAAGPRELYPETNATAGSALDGPHVDAKTARIVGAEERLFVVLTQSSVGGDAQASLTVRWYLDLRVLASMRSSQGNRRNASR